MTAPSYATVVSFAVRSTPVTQGSMTLIRGRIVPENAARLNQWRRLVATQARNAMRGLQPFTTPVQVQLIFWLHPPKVHQGKTWAAVRGRNDLDKLVRACGDAITESGLWQDDGLVARIEAEKRWCGEGERPGVDVTIEAL